MRPSKLVPVTSERDRPAEQDRIAEQYKIKLGAKAHNDRPDPSKKFYCEKDIIDVWSCDEDIKQLLGTHESKDVAAVRSRRLKILSVLVLMDWKGTQDESFLWNHLDEELPLDLEKLESGLGTLRGQAFYVTQYQCIPIHIVVAGKQTRGGHKIVELDDHHQWPFEHTPEMIGKGFYGTVFRATIAAGYYLEGGSSSSSPQVIAYKTINDKKAWEREVKNNVMLRESQVRHDNISIQLATFQRPDGFYVFMEHTSFGDLQLLLDEGKRQSFDRASQNDVQVYDFNEKFPDYERSHLFVQMERILAALDFLHHRLDVPGHQAKFRHLDLKPDNILIFHSADSSVGFWKISDFGISQTVGSAAGSNANSQISQRHRVGKHFAPEHHEQCFQRISGQKSDMWSYGCIFADVLAFATDKRKEVYHLENLLSKRRTTGDGFFDCVCSSKQPCGKNTLRSDGNDYTLKGCVYIWLDGLKEQARGAQDTLFEDRLYEYCNFLLRLLNPNPAERLDSEHAYRVLQAIQKFNPREHWDPSLAMEEPKLKKSMLTLPVNDFMQSGRWTSIVHRCLNFSTTEKVLDWTLSKAGDRAVFLFEKKIFVFQITTSGTAADVDFPHSMNSPKKIYFAGNFVGLSGISEVSGISEACFWDVRETTNKHVVQSSQLGYQPNLCLSSQGLLASITREKHISLLNLPKLLQEGGDKRQQPSAIQVDGMYVYQMAVNSVGTVLFVWTRHDSEDDTIDIYSSTNGEFKKRTFRFVIPTSHTNGDSRMITGPGSNCIVKTPGNRLLLTYESPGLMERRGDRGIVRSPGAQYAISTTSLFVLSESNSGRKLILHEYPFRREKHGNWYLDDNPIDLDGEDITSQKVEGLDFKVDNTRLAVSGIWFNFGKRFVSLMICNKQGKLKQLVFATSSPHG